jgi:uncharacterized membrane protein YeiB
MLKGVQFWVLSTIGAGCVLFVILNMVLDSGNQALQVQVSGQQQYIQQSLQLQGLYQQIVRAVADLSVRNHDEQLQAILTRQGLHLTVKPQSAASSAGPAPQKKPNEAPRGHHHD